MSTSHSENEMMDLATSLANSIMQDGYVHISREDHMAHVPESTLDLWVNLSQKVLAANERRLKE